MSRRFGLFFVCAWAVVLQAVPAHSGEGILSAVVYQPLPVGVAITVRPLDNSDANLVLQREFERQLRRLGHRVSPDGMLILTFETRNVIGTWSEPGRRTIIELEGRNAVGDDNSTKAMVNIYDSKRGGVLNKGQGGPSIVTPSQFRLEVTVDARQSGKRLWQGWTVADQGRTDGLMLTQAMIPSLVGNLGKTVRGQPISLP